MFEPTIEESSGSAVIKVIGVGGGGGNAVEHMVRESIEGVDFISVNTDAQALNKTTVSHVVNIGSQITKGLGAGANPQVGRDAALEDQDKIRNVISGADMIFITAGMGGGTGTGAAPVIAEIAKELGILTVAVVTKPFAFEGKKRLSFAMQGITELEKYVDSLITIPNEKLQKVLPHDISLLDAFAFANNVLKNAVQGIAELITKPGLMNVDFADVRTVMSEMGHAMMGNGSASGENRAEQAAKAAISYPLLEDIDLSGARGVLINITGGYDIGLNEFQIVGQTVESFASDNATVVTGAYLDPDLEGEIRVTVIATGLGIDKKPDVTPIAASKSKVEVMTNVASVTSNNVAYNTDVNKDAYIESKIAQDKQRAATVSAFTEVTSQSVTPNILNTNNVSSYSTNNTQIISGINVASKNDNSNHDLNILEIKDDGYLDHPTFIRNNINKLK